MSDCTCDHGDQRFQPAIAADVNLVRFGERHGGQCWENLPMNLGIIGSSKVKDRFQTTCCKINDEYILKEF